MFYNNKKKLVYLRKERMQNKLRNKYLVTYLENYEQKGLTFLVCNHIGVMNNDFRAYINTLGGSVRVVSKEVIKRYFVKINYPQCIGGMVCIIEVVEVKDLMHIVTGLQKLEVIDILGVVYKKRVYTVKNFFKLMSIRLTLIKFLQIVFLKKIKKIKEICEKNANNKSIV